MKYTFYGFTLLSIILSFGFSQNSKPFFHIEKEHNFSSINHKDIFKLSVYGKNMVDSYVLFKIIDWQGKEIYHHRFSMREYCDFGAQKTDKSFRQASNDSTFIIKELTQFFDEERFNNPAIKDTLDMNSNSIPREIWWDIWQDKTAIDFHYQLGAEDGRGIVYSKKKKKVIQYYACC